MAKLSAVGEVGLIARLRRRLGRLPGSVQVGIGDDAAVLRAPAGRDRRWLFASDMLVEGVHFTRAMPPRWIGWKALASNVSDIAAMGGRPEWAVVSLGAPPRIDVRAVERLYAGLRACATRYGVAIVGGDTVRAPCMVIDVAIIGTVAARHLTLRSTARVGDAVFVTGRLGGSLASGRHARFAPRLAQAQWLVRHVPVSAMMDLSDGLASDSWQLARASRVAIELDESRIPVASAAKTTWHALMDGEDFELLFTVPARAAARVPSRIEGVPVTRVGRVLGRGPRVTLLRNGRTILLKPEGFRHF